MDHAIGRGFFFSHREEDGRSECVTGHLSVSWAEARRYLASGICVIRIRMVRDALVVTGVKEKADVQNPTSVSWGGSVLSARRRKPNSRPAVPGSGLRLVI